MPRWCFLRSASPAALALLALLAGCAAPPAPVPAGKPPPYAGPQSPATAPKPPAGPGGEAVKVAVPKLQTVCGTCHGLYRERLDDGTYRFKPTTK